MAGVTIKINPAGPEIINGEMRPTPVIMVSNETSGDKEIDTTENSPRTSEKEENAETVQERKSKRGISITRALVLFGYDSWVALEPGK